MRRPTALNGTLSTLLGVALLAGLGGCSVGPDYVKPETSLAPFHNAQVNAPQGSGSTAADKQDRQRQADLANWWKGSNDPQLVSIVEQVLAQNLDLAASVARVAQARAAAQAAGAALYPTVDFQGASTKQRQSLQSPLGELSRNLPGYERNQKELTAGAVASWELDVAGGLRRGASAAEATAQAAESEHMGTRISVVAEAADAYVQIRGYQARLAVAADQIDTDEHLLRLVQVRHRLGEVTERDKAQAQALLKQARASVPLLRIALEAQLNRLDVLMANQPGRAALLVGNRLDIPTLPTPQQSLEPTDMLRRRPDIIAAERQLAASNERIGEAIADYYPKLSLSGVLGYDSTTGHHLFTSQAFQPSIGGLVRWRLFDFGKIDAEVAHAKGEQAEALARYRQSVLRGCEDVENALVAVAQTEERRKELADEVVALTRARDLSERAYKSGAITLTDVLDANRELLVARDSLSSTQSDSTRAVVSLYRSIGGGWDGASVQAAN
ncbi:efflux transporter outer membrane subunit [Pseudomonas sp. GD03842]|uniref:efflux transporter outer membrane subunit n=1 Tax=Pseudomonas sp. GD03842 TaxID=2975385 RepID=UPI00244B0D7B|nr:efflux transporter outer membrane subunit [Pseudomonas sp. GD03842]MDH0745122.1 efflux transporter outer membrane subunit [Pseudomonas sp. GD03842]